jgi:hypothetical protein
VTAELTHGRFTIATDDPHVKVGWRIRGRWREGESDSDNSSSPADQRRL